MQSIASRIIRIVIGFCPSQRNRVIVQPIGIFKDGKIEGEKTAGQREKTRNGARISSRLNKFI